jgi:hypothetical protein
VEANNSCAGSLIFGSFFFIVLCQSFFSFFPPIFAFFLLSVLLSFLLLSNWFLFLLSFIFPLLFRHCFIPVSLAHVVSYLAYPNLLGTKRLGCCCCCYFKMNNKLTEDDEFNNEMKKLNTIQVRWHTNNLSSYFCVTVFLHVICES